MVELPLHISSPLDLGPALRGFLFLGRRPNEQAPGSAEDSEGLSCAAVVDCEACLIRKVRTPGRTRVRAGQVAEPAML